MALTLRWVGEEEFERVAETRMFCYAGATKELERFREGMRSDKRARPGDFLLAERNGAAVGTSTSLSLTMWVRGAPLSCQGVAYVGTIKTHRRGGSGSNKGIATQIMAETLRKAREREQVVSALMPFRASYYEHFGYGVVETRNEWTIPLSILPSGDFDGFSFVRSPEELAGMMECRRRIVEAGQCDIERSPQAWEAYRRRENEAFTVIDRGADGTVHGIIEFMEKELDGRQYVRAIDQHWDSLASLRRQLHFLASLRDEFGGAILTLPRDVPLNRLLRETQIPHRAVEHAVSKVVPYTRMQVRILDHKRFCQALHVPVEARGNVSIAVRECEGTVSRLKMEISGGRVDVSDGDGTADIECDDKTWAAIACGEVMCSQAARIGLLRASPDVARVLDVLAEGPVPFCAEYF